MKFTKLQWRLLNKVNYSDHIMDGLLESKEILIEHNYSGGRLRAALLWLQNTAAEIFEY